MAASGATRAAGQSIQSPYEFIETRHEVSVFGGGTTDDRGTVRLGPSGGTMFGARYSFELTGPVALEGGFTYLAGDREVYDPRTSAAEPALLGVADANVGFLDARARLNLTGPRTWNSFAPYVFGGLGLAFDLSGETELDDELDLEAQFSFDPSFLGSFGGGVRWLVGERIGARLEGTFAFWRLAHPIDFRIREQNASPVPSSEWAQWLAVTIGATYRF